METEAPVDLFQVNLGRLGPCPIEFHLGFRLLKGRLVSGSTNTGEGRAFGKYLAELIYFAAFNVHPFFDDPLQPSAYFERNFLLFPTLHGTREAKARRGVRLPELHDRDRTRQGLRRSVILS